MSEDKVTLRRSVRDLDESPAYDPISCIRLITGTDQNGNSIIYTAGDPRSGRTLEVENRLIRDPAQGQLVAQNILQTVQGYAYKPFSAPGAILDPAAEVGDGVVVGDIYSVLADIETTFSPLMTANIGAPEDGSIDHEYPYESSENRLIAQEIQGLRTSFIVENGRIAAEISDVQQTQEGLASKVTSLEITVDGIHAYTDREIQVIAGGVVEDWAEINFTPDGISTLVSSYFDAKGAAASALADSKTYTDGKIAPIAGEYTSAIEQSAKEIKATVAAQESKWDLSGLPSGVTISAYGYGQPSNATAGQYSGQYYLDQTSGRWYRSNGSKWTIQTGSLKLITTNLDSRITQQSNLIQSTVQDVASLGTQVSQISQKADSISLSVSSDAYGRSTFVLSNNQAVLDTETVYLNVDAAHITGTIYANEVRAGASIASPLISGGTIVGTEFTDVNYDASLRLYSQGNGGALAYGPTYSPSFRYFSVAGVGTTSALMNLGNAAMIAFDNGVFYPRGIWDFSQCTVRGLP